MDNHQLLPNVIDGIARTNPDTPWIAFPRSKTTYTDGFRETTFKEFANAVNGAANWIKNTLGTSQKFDTLTYIGPNDLRYPVMVVAAIKAGYKLLLISPRNNVAANVNLFKLTNCTTVISPAPHSAILGQVGAVHPITILEPPSIEELLDKKHAHFPYDKDYENAKNDPFVVMHTSGSTGLPKPVITPHAFVTAFANTIHNVPPAGYENQTKRLHGKRLFLPMPLFHALGVFFTLISGCYARTNIVIPLTNAPPTAKGVAELVKYTRVNAAILAPSIVEEISKDPQLLEAITSKLDTLVFSGGNLPEKLGDVVAKKVYVFSLYGATEFGHGRQIAEADRPWSDWKYIQWDERGGSGMEHHSDSMHEFVFKRTASVEDETGCFTIFKDAAEYRTKDLFTPHPQKPGLWMYCERTDNILVLSNGEKVNPLGFEEAVTSDPLVKASILIGAEQSHTVLLVELKNNGLNEGKEKIIERLWPTISAANAAVPSFARVSKDFILFTHPDNPIQMTPKGTVVRKTTIESYEQEIHRIYNPVSQGAGKITRAIASHDKNSVAATIEQQLCVILHVEKVDRQENLFQQGVDSILAMELARSLHISPSTIYSHPVINDLASILIAGEDSSNHSNAASDALATYRKQLKRIQPRSAQGSGQVVLLTGSTGAIGSYLLDALLREKTVSHIYCLNRSSDARERQVKGNTERHLTSDLSPDRVTFLTGNVTSNANLGLDYPIVSQLQFQVTKIIHNAWPVDFNANLDSFTGHLDGIVHLSSFAAGARHNPTIFFLSSIGAVQRYSSFIPENIISDDAAVSNPNGYGQSKRVAEILLDDAAKQLGLDTTIARLGQVAGPVKGPGGWKMNEWLPSLVISSQYLGVVLDGLPAAETQRGEVDWVPVDILADVILELLFAPQEKRPNNGARVYHVSNPSVESWSTLVSEVVKVLSTKDKVIEVVPYHEWLQKLQSAQSSLLDEGSLQAAIQKIPAVKLIEFYESLGKENEQGHSFLDTTHTAQTSSTLAKMEAIQPADMAKWTTAWMEQISAGGGEDLERK